MGLLDGWTVQISRHPKGFWQGDLFDGGAEVGVPEAFFTMSVGGSREAAIAKAQEKWPYAEIYVVDRCAECDHGMDENEECCSACDGTGEIARPLLETL